MKVYVLTDLEGPAMTSTWEQVLDDAPREKEYMGNVRLLGAETSHCEAA